MVVIRIDRKRSDMEILADILRVAMGGAKKSHIVYKANLNFEVVKKYLKRLREAGLIVFPPDGSRLFKTTPKGVEYLKQYEILLDHIKPLAKPNKMIGQYAPIQKMTASIS